MIFFLLIKLGNGGENCDQLMRAILWEVHLIFGQTTSSLVKIMDGRQITLQIRTVAEKTLSNLT